MAIFTIGGREMVAQILLGQKFFLGLCHGTPDWDAVIEPPSATATDLVDKFGLTRMRRLIYVVPIRMARSRWPTARSSPPAIPQAATSICPSSSTLPMRRAS